MGKEKQLLDAAINNDWNTVLELLKQDDINVNAIVPNGNYRGMSTLMFAVSGSKYDVVELLISKGANVNAVATRGTALMIAVAYADLCIVALLLANGAKINAAVENGLYPGKTALTIAIVLGNHSAVDLLIRNGAEINATVTYGDFKDYSALLIAAINGEWAIVRLLIEKSAFITNIDTVGKIESIKALKNKNLKLIKFLLTQGVTVNLNNPDWKDALNKVDIDDQKGAACAAYIRRVDTRLRIMPLLQYNNLIRNKAKTNKPTIDLMTHNMITGVSEMLTGAKTQNPSHAPRKKANNG